MNRVMDQALEILKDAGPEYGKGFSNHGPMAAEALLALGRDDDVLPWVLKYRKRLPSCPVSRDQIDTENYTHAMGDIGRFADWTLFIEKELREEPWRAVLNRWVPRLAPGMIGAAFHGIIRTGHAVRNLIREETSQRLRELACGLAYWAARYQMLPGVVETKQTGLKPTEALSRIKILPSDKRIWHGLIYDKVRALSGSDSFADVINLVDASINMDSFISDLFEATVRIYLGNARDRGSIITFIHAVTGPGAVHLMIPCLAGDTARMALLYSWQASAGIYAAVGLETDHNAYHSARDDGNIDPLIQQAVTTGDEHAIKFTEVCLRAYRLDPKPIFLIAARHAVENLGK